MEDNTLGTAEAAEVMRVSRQRVHQMIVEGKLPAIKVYGQWRISRREVDRHEKVRRGDQTPAREGAK